MFTRFTDDQLALIDATTGESVTYADLARRLVNHRFASLRRGLVFLFGANTLDTIIAYLAAVDAGHAVALIDSDLNAELADHLVGLYRPDYVWSDGFRQRGGEPTVLHPDLAILLSTSGSTGSPKFVRLSRDNIISNTDAIAKSLHLARTDRAITCMPLAYSYGMSVLHSHLWVGASIVVCDASVLEPALWDAVRTHHVTSLAGVPFSYQMMKRLRLPPDNATSLTKMTQAGGHMSDELTTYFHNVLAPRGIDLYCMYGQTEAAPRISCVPPEHLMAKLGTAGLPLDGGQLLIKHNGVIDTAPNVEGEVVYRGPNVMMGYAVSPGDLALGDVQGDTLDTGDLGYLDADGFLFITGRSKRITKVYGSRINLDEVEHMVTGAGLGHVGAVGGAEDQIQIFHDAGDIKTADAVRRNLAATLKVPVAAIVLRQLPALPVMSTGKTDYKALATSVMEGP